MNLSGAQSQEQEYLTSRFTKHVQCDSPLKRMAEALSEVRMDVLFPVEDESSARILLRTSFFFVRICSQLMNMARQPCWIATIYGLDAPIP